MAVCWEWTHSVPRIGNNELQFLLPGARVSSPGQHSASKSLGEFPFFFFFFFPESSYLRLLASVKAAILIPPAEEE